MKMVVSVHYFFGSEKIPRIRSFLLNDSSSSVLDLVLFVSDCRVTVEDVRFIRK